MLIKWEGEESLYSLLKKDITLTHMYLFFLQTLVFPEAFEKHTNSNEAEKWWMLRN